jgi:hypothetical protein
MGVSAPNALDAGLRGLVHDAARDVHAAAERAVDTLVAATAGLVDTLTAAAASPTPAGLPRDEADAFAARARARALRAAMTEATGPLAHTLVEAMRVEAARLHPLATTLDLLAPRRSTLAPTLREVERSLQDARTADGAAIQRVAEQLAEALGLTPVLADGADPDDLRPLRDPTERARRLRPVCHTRFLRLLDPVDAWLSEAP